MTKLELAEKSFMSVLRHVEHEDDKANRILVAMAFLTTAAAALFSILFDPSNNPTQLISGRHVNLTVLFFLVFLGLVVLGTLFMLAALGPKFTLLPEWRRPQKAWEQTSSFLFAEVIAKHPFDVWLSQWQKPVLLIEGELERHYFTEAYVLSRAAVFKVAMMKYGRQLYRLALLALMYCLTFSLITPLSLSFPVCLLITSLWLLQSGFELVVEPGATSGIALSSLLSEFPRLSSVIALGSLALGIGGTLGSVALLAVRI